MPAGRIYLALQISAPEVPIAPPRAWRPRHRPDPRPEAFRPKARVYQRFRPRNLASLGSPLETGQVRHAQDAFA